MALLAKATAAYSQVSPPHSGRSQEQDVGRLGHQGQSAQFLDLPFVDGGLEGEVELLQGVVGQGHWDRGIHKHWDTLYAIVMDLYQVEAGSTPAAGPHPSPGPPPWRCRRGSAAARRTGTRRHSRGTG